MVSDSELVCRLREFLSTSDLNTTTTATVRRHLEEDFGIDLSDKKAFIREQIDLYLVSQRVKEEEVVEEEEEEEEIENSRDENEEEEEEEEDEDEEEEEEEGSKRGKRKNKETKKRGGGFTKLCSLSPQLQKFTGVPELARTEVVKQLWSYIREKNLQDPTNRRNILCDETLHELFDVDSINMFQMNKSLAKHIWPLHSDGPVSSIQKEKPQKQEKGEDAPKRKVKRQKGDTSQKGGTSGFLVPILLSDALVKFLGTGENALARSAVVKRIWDYIKQNNLQDPSDKRRIICDEKLKELFEVDTFNGFTVSKLLTAHFIKTASISATTDLRFCEPQTFEIGDWRLSV